jgi:MFS family permease
MAEQIRNSYATKRILPLIVLSQFCCTSLWFAGNGVMPELIENFNLQDQALGHLTSAVQLGFIAGTFIYALFTIADRFSPSRVFFFSASIASIFNFAIIFEANTFATLLTFRFITGFFLAGIYPVGMKIAADYYEKELGLSLGFLVGALVVGTGFPHLLKNLTGDLPWMAVLIITSILAIAGGLLILFGVPDGPFRKPGQKPDFSLIFRFFRHREFRSAAFGYFGHMWELYTFWAFVPVILMTYTINHPQVNFNIPLLSFIIIGSGGVACVIAGYLSGYFGNRKTASLSLLLSGLCCAVSPLVFIYLPKMVFILFLVFWGMVVVADSPLFSTLVADSVPAETKGTALTIVNSIGFAITIISIQLITFLSENMNPFFVFTILAAGPAAGLAGVFWKSIFMENGAPKRSDFKQPE